MRVTPLVEIFSKSLKKVQKSSPVSKKIDLFHITFKILSHLYAQPIVRSNRQTQ